jgi:hypothetical protein
MFDLFRCGGAKSGGEIVGRDRVFGMILSIKVLRSMMLALLKGDKYICSRKMGFGSSCFCLQSFCPGTQGCGEWLT